MLPALVIEPTVSRQAAVADVTAAPAGTVAMVPSSTADAAAAEARFKVRVCTLSLIQPPPRKLRYLVILMGTDNAVGALDGPSRSSPL
jgi:hypothetical protein